MPDSIEVVKMRDFFVFDKWEGQTTILPGSNIFCGCCGKPIGRVIEPLIFPFSPHILVLSMEDVSITRAVWGARHSCGHTLFIGGKGWSFVSLDIWKEQVKKDKEEAHKHKDYNYQELLTNLPLQ